MTDEVVDIIRENRRQRGWTMAELAERSGLSENVIENIESGRRDKQGRRRRRITIEELEAIGQAFGFGVQFSLLPGPEVATQAEEWRRMQDDTDVAAAMAMIQQATEVLNRAIERWRERQA